MPIVHHFHFDRDGNTSVEVKVVKRQSLYELREGYLGFYPVWRVEMAEFPPYYPHEVSAWFRIMLDYMPWCMVDPNTFNLIIEFERELDAYIFANRFQLEYKHITEEIDRRENGDAEFE